MLKPADHFHGSDLEKIESLYQIKKEDIISFSANVNPLGLSSHFKDKMSDKLDVITTYPDREYKALRTVIGNYCNADPRNIIVGNGSTELISLMIQLRNPKKALILGPTYSEYEREITLAGGSCLYFLLEESENFVLNEAAFISSLREDIDLLVICNPNNPTASVISSAKMRSIMDACKRLDIFVMIDETYIEFAPDYHKNTCVPLAAYYNNLVILRGVSKFFAAPGLRLGYAVTGSEALVRTVSEKQNPWTVSSLADAAGQLLFTDTEYINRSRDLIQSERERVTAALSKIDGIKCYPSYCNFILVKILNPNLTSYDLFDVAIRRGLMIRNCSTFPFLDHFYFRFCFMNPKDNDKLLLCISQFLAGEK